MEVSEKKTRRQYSDEYKSEAVRLVRESGKPLSQVARELGINDNMLHRWSREERVGLLLVSLTPCLER
jgi:transposase